MANRKRGPEQGDLIIKLAESPPLHAESIIVRPFSSCAKALPADATEWDVSGLLYDSQPFSRRAVECWLHVALSNVYGPAELDAADTAQLSTAKGLHEVLAFANAVGSPEALCRAACSQLSKLDFVVTLPQQTVQLRMAGGLFSFRGSPPRQQLVLCSLTTHQHVGEPLSTDQERMELQQQVAEQAGALLHMAYILQLQPLIDALHSFLSLSSGSCDHLLTGVLDKVFTDSVVDAVLGTSRISKEAYITSVLTQPCGFQSTVGCRRIFKPVQPFEHDPSTGTQTFDAVLLQDFAGGKEGDKVTVEVDLFRKQGPEMVVTAKQSKKHRNRQPCRVQFPAQLLLGFAVTDADDMQYVVGGGAADD